MSILYTIPEHINVEIYTKIFDGVMKEYNRIAGHCKQICDVMCSPPYVAISELPQNIDNVKKTFYTLLRHCKRGYYGECVVGKLMIMVSMVKLNRLNGASRDDIPLEFIDKIIAPQYFDKPIINKLIVIMSTYGAL